MEISSTPAPPSSHRQRLADAASSGQPFVHFDRVTASWTDTSVLVDVSLHVRPGDLVAVVGPVGAGKTSLLMAALGELLPHHGSITINGKVLGDYFIKEHNRWGTARRARPRPAFFRLACSCLRPVLTPVGNASATGAR